MRIERELMRGAGPAAVLKLLERGAKYGYELVESLSVQTGGVLDMGQATLYPMLYNLEAKGEIEGFWQEAQSGRDRKYYRLTSKGKKRLAAESAHLQNLASALVKLGVIKASAMRTGGEAVAL